MEACWRTLREEDLPALLELCRGNDAYYSYIRCTPDRENLREQLTVLPPGAAPEQKQFLGRWEGDDLTAILDVTFPEPPVQGHPFYTLPNCILTPHIAWACFETRQRLMDIAVDNVRQFLAGTPVNNVAV